MLLVRLQTGVCEVKPILNLTGKLPNSLWGFRLVLTAILLTTGVSALRLTFNLGYYYNRFECTELWQITCYLSMAGSYVIVITASLVLSAIGLWSRRLLGFLFSLISLAWIGETYREWYTATLYNMQIFGAREFYQLQGQQQYLLPLDQAGWWDIVVLGVALIVFSWQAVMLKRILKPTAILSENRQPSTP